MEDEEIFTFSEPVEAERKFAKDRGVAKDIPTSVHIKVFVKNASSILFPLADESVDTDSYIAFIRSKKRPYKKSALHPIETSRRREEASYEKRSPLVIGGRRVHKVIIPIALVGLILLIGVVRVIILPLF